MPTLFAKCLRRRGMTGTDAAAYFAHHFERAGKKAPSETAVRKWIRGSRPRLGNAVIIAKALPMDGKELLLDWGYPIAAEGVGELAERLAALYGPTGEGVVNFIPYQGEPLSDSQIEAVRSVIRAFQRGDS